MKKILFLALATAMLCCIFAVAVNAEGIKRFETDEFQEGDNVTFLEGINEDMFLLSDTQNNSAYELIDPDFLARAVLKNSDGTYTTYPAWYFMSFQQYWNGAEYRYGVSRINEMSHVTGETYAMDSIIRFEWPEYKADHTFYLKTDAGVLSMPNLIYARVASHFESTGGAFQGAKYLTEIEYAPNSRLQSIGDRTFKDCISMEVIRIPNTVTKLDNQVFVYWGAGGASNAILKEIYLGASVTTLGKNESIKAATMKGLKIYVPDTLDGATYTFDEYFPSSSMVIFTGNKENAEKFGTSVVMSYEEYEASGFAHVPGAIVYGYSSCEAFFDGEHKLTGEATMQSVDYFKDVIFADTCTKENCGKKIIDDEKTIGAIFIDYGYSITENAIGGKLSMSQFFGINQDNLKKYTDATSKAFEYGVVVSTSNDPMNEENSDLIAQGKTYIATQNKIPHDYFVVIVTGFVAQGENANVDKGLTFCAYVKDGDNVSYLDNGATSQVVEIKSYNMVKALLKKSENNTDITE